MSDKEPKKRSITMPIYTQALHSEDANNQNNQDTTNGKQ